jgi:hypothetical protein
MLRFTNCSPAFRACDVASRGNAQGFAQGSGRVTGWWHHQMVNNGHLSKKLAHAPVGEAHAGLHGSRGRFNRSAIILCYVFHGGKDRARCSGEFAPKRGHLAVFETRFRLRRRAHRRMGRQILKIVQNAPRIHGATVNAQVTRYGKYPGSGT